jgi:lysophospholipase L1-like esterase
MFKNQGINSLNYTESHILMKIRQLIYLGAIALFSFMDFNPAWCQTTLRIMPLGNSMTEGWMDGTELPAHRIAYRRDLKNLLNGANYSTDFVGSHQYGCLDFNDCECAGIDGTRDQFLETMLSTGYDPRWGVQETTGPYLDAFNPDVIFLSIGTNDITHDGDPDEPDAVANQRVSAILDLIKAYELRAHRPVMVFLALIINRKKLANGDDAPGTYTTIQWNQTIKAMAQQRIANGDKLVIVDMEHDAGFSYAYASNDFCQTDPEGLHPSAAGYTKMANLWFQKFIANYNSAPVISAIPNQTVAEGTAFSTIQLDNYVSDVEDADQYITWTSAQLGTSNLNITINGSRQAVVIPKDINWNGSQTVVFTATDRGRGGNYIKSDADTVVFTVTANNDAPVITGQSALSIDEDNSIALSLSNFTIFDPDSDPSTFQLLILPGTNYSVNGSIITPSANYAGNLSVNVAVKDATLQGPTYSAMITVNPVNDPPVYMGQPDIAIDEDANYVVNIQNFNVTDPDNTLAQLTFVILPGPNFTIEGMVITPDANFNGTLYVESYIRDPLGATSNSFYLQIIVNPVNDPPVFTSTPVDKVDINAQYVYSIKVTDPDPEDVLVLAVPIKPSWMTFYSNSKLLAGVPHADDSGDQSVSISVTDGHVTVYQSYVLYVNGPTSNAENESGSIRIYPNPASDRIILDLKNQTQDAVLEIYDMTGKPLLKKRYCPDCDAVLYIHDNHLTSGIYLYTITTSEKTIKGKLIIYEQ